MLPAAEKSKYGSIVSALKKRFRSLDIEELRGLEFHQLMQDNQTVEEVGVRLQKLARKAFSGIGPKEFDRLLKGRFYQASMPKWQRKLGAPKPSETFDELYARARTLERHDQQINAKRSDAKPSTHPQKATVANEGSHQKPTAHDRPAGSGSQNHRPSGRGFSMYRPRCGVLGHIERDCTKQKTESPGKSSRVATLAAEKPEELTIPQLEQMIATKRLNSEKAKLGDSVAKVCTITGGSSISAVGVAAGAIGPMLRLEVEIEGHPVRTVGAQSAIISQHVLHEVARHMCRQGRQVPVPEQPSVKLYGHSGTNSSELTITAQAELQFSHSVHDYSCFHSPQE